MRRKIEGVRLKQHMPKLGNYVAGINGTPFVPHKPAMNPIRKKSLCSACNESRSDPLTAYPAHLVHPVTLKPGEFDESGDAICLRCKAKWRRTPQELTLLR
jgi:hypothetical protein